MTPHLLARSFRRFCLLPHFRGKSRIEHLIEPFIPGLPSAASGVALPWGATMRLNWDSDFERGCYYRNGEKDTFDLLRSSLRPGDVFADCGANLGLFTLLGSNLVGPAGHVHAFEPTPATFDRLRAHLDMNGCKNVTAWRLALSDTDGAAPVYQLSASNHGMNFVGAAPTERAAEQVGECEFTSLDSLIASGRMQRPTFMKIDVEGGELKLLRGAKTLLSAPRPPTMLVELARGTTNRFGYEPEEIVAFIHSQSAGRYRVEWPFLGQRRPVAPGAPLPHYAILGRDHGANYLFTPSV